MRSQSNIIYLHRKPARAVAIAAQVEKRRSHEFLTTGFYIIVAGTLLGLGLANLSALSGAVLTALNILPAHLI